MKKNLVILFLAVLTSPIYAQQTQNNKAIAYIDSALKKFDKAGPGAVLQVVHKGQTVYHKAYGLADLELNVKLTENSVFEAASVSKQFAATSILLLVEAGKIKIEEDVRKYVPELPDYGKPVTIAQLLTHTSGLRDWRNMSGLTAFPTVKFIYEGEDVQQLIFRQRALSFPNGTKYSYSNSNYDMLALIVERVSGEKFADFSTKNILKPIGMTNSTWGVNRRTVVKNRAKSFAKSKNGFISHMPLDNTTGAAGLLTTTADLQKWIAWWRDGKFGPVLAKLRLQHYVLENGDTTTYALGGVHVYNISGLKLISHTGLLGGYRALTSYYPDIDLAITFLSNTRELIVPQIADKMVEIYGGIKPTKVDSTKLSYITLTTKEIQQKVGLYKNTQGPRTVELLNKDGKLRLKNGAELKALDKNTLVAGDDEYKFKVGELLLPEEGALSPYKKVESLSPKSALLSSLAGAYYSSDLNTEITISKDEDALRYTRNGYQFVSLKPAYKDGDIVGFSSMDNGIFMMFDFDIVKNTLKVSLSRALGIGFEKRQ